MPLKSDSQGFLVGDPVDLKVLADEWKGTDAKLASIQRSVSSIEKLLRMQTVEARRSAQPNSTLRRSRQTEEQPAATPTQGRRTASSALEPNRQENLKAQARPENRREQPRESTPPLPSIKAKGKANGKASADDVPAALPERGENAENQAAETPERDAKGRFISKNGGDSDAQEKREGSAIAKALSTLADMAEKGSEDVSEADPAVQAMQEAVTPLTRTYDFFKDAFGSDKEEGWLKRIFRTLGDFRKQESAFNKAQDRRLKAIEKKPVGAAGAKEGGGLLSGIPGLGGLAGGASVLLSGAAKRIPIIGAAFAGLKGLYDVWSSESDDTLTREEKDKRTGSAVGGAAGSIGVGFLGAKAGAMIGGLFGPLGAALGAIAGSAIGMISGTEVGKQVGEWGGQIVSLFREVPGKMEAAWDGLTSTISSGWETVSSKFSDTWDKVKENASDTFDKIGEKFGVKDASKKLADTVGGFVTSIKGLFTGDDEPEEEEAPKVDPNGNPFDPNKDLKSWKDFEIHRRAYEREGFTPENARFLAKDKLSDSRTNLYGKYGHRDRLGNEEFSKIVADVDRDAQTAGLSGGDRMRGIAVNPYDAQAQSAQWEAFELQRAALEARGMSPQEASASARSNFSGVTAENFDEKFSDLSKFDRDRIRNQVRMQKDVVGTWHLGQTSQKFESGGRGAAAVSRGIGDAGGASYGTYQLSSRTGTLNEFLKDSGYASKFEGLKPGTKAFNNKWKEVAANDQSFGKAQHDFIKRTHYDPAMQRLQEAGIDLSSRGPAVKDAIWSTSVQYGAGTARRKAGAVGMVKEALKGADVSQLSDAEIISRIQDYKASNNSRLFRSSSSATKMATLNRAREEKQALLALNDRYQASLQNPETPLVTQAEAHERLTNPEKPLAVAPESVAKTIEAPARAPERAAATVAEAAGREAPAPQPFSLANNKAAAVAPVTSLDALASARPAQVASVPAPQGPAVLPKAPAAPAPAPTVSTTLSAGGKERPTVVTVENEVGQDLRERGIAHIATGGIA